MTVTSEHTYKQKEQRTRRWCSGMGERRWFVRGRAALEAIFF